VDCSVEELAAADLVVLCVDHPELPYDDIVDHARLVLDTRGRLRGLGFRGETL
jgi:UDP-N-acetyl-D-mannosaminuronate dehydrogenase